MGAGVVGAGVVGAGVVGAGVVGAGVVGVGVTGVVSAGVVPQAARAPSNRTVDRMIAKIRFIGAPFAFVVYKQYHIPQVVSSTHALILMHSARQQPPHMH